MFPLLVTALFAHRLRQLCTHDLSTINTLADAYGGRPAALLPSRCSLLHHSLKSMAASVSIPPIYSQSRMGWLSAHRLGSMSRTMSENEPEHRGVDRAKVPLARFANASFQLWNLCRRHALPMPLVLAAMSLSSSPAWAATGLTTGERASSGLSGVLSFILHLDKHLTDIISKHGRKTYALLFAIVFAETGLVVTPFLPGDSLLFACGALSALNALNLPTLVTALFTAAVLGDATNYAAGSFLGREAFSRFPRILNPAYLNKTEAFFEKYGGKTIVLARFVPIVRTFAPFVAGIGSMSYSAFAFFNILGAAIWTLSFTILGYFFGGLPFVKENFAAVTVGIVIVSVLPIVAEFLAAQRESKGPSN